jgi:hypothetical protein
MKPNFEVAAIFPSRLETSVFLPIEEKFFGCCFGESMKF